MTKKERKKNLQSKQHTQEVNNVLSKHDALGMNGKPLRWNKTIKQALKDAGHSSISFEKCSCNPKFFSK